MCHSKNAWRNFFPFIPPPIASLGLVMAFSLITETFIDNHNNLMLVEDKLDTMMFSPTNIDKLLSTAPHFPSSWSTGERYRRHISKRLCVYTKMKLKPFFCLLALCREKNPHVDLENYCVARASKGTFTRTHAKTTYHQG